MCYGLTHDILYNKYFNIKGEKKLWKERETN